MKELLTLSGAGILAMLMEMFNLKKYVFPVALVGLAASIGFSIIDWNNGQEVVYGMMRLDRFALAFNAVMCTTAIFWCMLSEQELERKNNIVDYFALLFFALTGALLMVSFTNLTLLFLGIEILSISMYVLAGSNKADTRSNESAFKYFLMGSFAAGFLLFGIALIYGMTGTFDTPAIALKVQDLFLHNTKMPLMTMGILMIIVGMGFKVSGAPFHFWAPDVYQGAPTMVTAFMATVVKTAAFAAFYRLFHDCAFPTIHGSWDDIIAGMVILSLMIGNISAVMQVDVKRMLAYSSISHAGYMLMAIMLSSTESSKNILFYTVSYSLASITAFAVLNSVSKSKKSTSISAFDGLGKTNPLLAAAMSISLLSMAGIPPFAGFLAKYFMFKDVILNGHIWIVIFAITMSLVGVYYYFKLIIAMYFHPSSDGSQKVEIDSVITLLLIMTCSLLLILGLVPGLIYDLL
jgi:NADH-quinone oxidoreductase subunit N